MGSLIKSEYIKGKRSFGRKSLFIFPLVVTCLAIVLMGGQLTQIGALNWWYMMFLPATIALVSTNSITVEKNNEFFNVDILPYAKNKVWNAKIWVGVSYIFLANMFIFLMTTISGTVFGVQYTILRGVGAAFTLTIAVAWQAPLGMFLAAKFNSSVTLITIIAANFICSIQDIAGGKAWFIPFAIPARLMAPILGINPNGVPLEASSPLQATNVILPGIFITSILFAILFISSSKWFKERKS